MEAEDRHMRYEYNQMLKAHQENLRLAGFLPNNDCPWTGAPPGLEGGAGYVRPELTVPAPKPKAKA